MLTLKNLDSIEYLKTLEDNSIDLCVTDPPYGISFNASFHMDNDDWDKMPMDEFDRFYIAWMSEIYRVLKPTGTMWMFCAPTKIPELFKIIDKIGFT